MYEETPWTATRKEIGKRNKAFFDRTRDEFYKKMGWELPYEKTNAEKTEEKKKHLEQTLNKILK